MSEIRTNELKHSTGASAITVDELGNVTLSANLQLNGQSNLLPDPTNKAGQFLTTDGSTISYQPVLPDPTNKAGQFLTTDGSTISYQPVDLITYSIALG